MKATAYRELTIEELRVREADIRKNLFTLRTRATTKELHDVSRIKAEKHDLARILTVIRQKEAAAAPKA